MPRLQAAVPPGAPPNALLRVRLPDGTEVNVRVPEGLKPGDEFIFEVSSMGDFSKDSKKVSVGEGVASGKGIEKKKEKASTPAPGNNTKKRHGGKNPPHSQQQQQNSSAKSSKKKAGSVIEVEDSQTISAIPSFSSLFSQIYEQVLETLTQESLPRSSLSQQSLTNHRSSMSHSRKNTPSQNQQQGPQKQLTTYLGFLDREIVNGKDFLTALAIGMFIGMSIVLGFLVGVLAVTPVTQ